MTPQRSWRAGSLDCRSSWYFASATSCTRTFPSSATRQPHNNRLAVDIATHDHYNAAQIIVLKRLRTRAVAPSQACPPERFLLLSCEQVDRKGGAPVIMLLPVVSAL